MATLAGSSTTAVVSLSAVMVPRPLDRRLAMADLTQLLRAHRSAVDEMVVAAEKSGSAWTTPRAPGKWSPQQIVEHVARAYEEGANVIEGRPTKLPTLPFFIRPLARAMFNRAVRSGSFPKARTNRAMDPAKAPTAGPAAASGARGRLETALATFESASRTRAAAGQAVNSGAFGQVSVEDYVRFTELHTRHHTKQIPTAHA
jgi:hypothetical protein